MLYYADYVWYFIHPFTDSKLILQLIFIELKGGLKKGKIINYSM